MRLIDADKAKVILWGYSRFSGIDEAPYEYAEEAIDILPTIEAIPIEWIKEYANRGSQYHLYAEEVEATILSMLEDWEKENEDTCMQLRQR